MSLEIICPECGQVGNVADGTIGHTVKCPACGLKMIVTDPSATSIDGLAVDDPTAAPEPWVPVQLAVDPESPSSMVQGPATALIVTAVVNIGLSLFMIHSFFQTNSVRQMFRGMGAFAGQQRDVSPEHAQQVREGLGLVDSILASTGFMSLVTGLLGIASSGVVFAGALAMMSLRWYPLAVAGSVLAIIPMISLCCLLGLPFGIWSLVVLLQPDVRAAFS